jgi:hypothetical protein
MVWQCVPADRLYRCGLRLMALFDDLLGTHIKLSQIRVDHSLPLAERHNSVGDDPERLYFGGRPSGNKPLAGADVQP